MAADESASAQRRTLPRRPRGAALGLVLAVFFLVVGFLAGQAGIVNWSVRTWPWVEIGGVLTSFAFGALVGLSEILTRYRDEPLRATFNTYGWVYLGFNGLISVAAYALLRNYADQIFPAVADDTFLTSVVAGFGAMVIMRSKLFTFNSPEGEEYAVGPAIVIDTVLQTIDRKIDRLRAAARQQLVYDRLRQVTDFEPAAQYFEASLQSFQNLSAETKSALAAVVDQYRTAADWDPRLKIMALGFAFLTITGEENFDRIVDNMRNFLEERS